MVCAETASAFGNYFIRALQGASRIRRLVGHWRHLIQWSRLAQLRGPFGGLFQLCFCRLRNRGFVTESISLKVAIPLPWTALRLLSLLAKAFQALLLRLHFCHLSSKLDLRAGSEGLMTVVATSVVLESC